jgi:lipopolysaccharide/colanic/teichoic acid biosynthesis glycosyltransferase
MHLVKKTWWYSVPSLKTSHWDIHEPHKFKEILARECARVERIGSHFTLLSFKAHKSKEGLRFLVKLMRLLKKRIRQSDDLGWLASYRIGVLLYNTDAVNAIRFVSELKKNDLGIGSNINYKVYVYPFEKPDDPDHPEGLQEKKNISRSQMPHDQKDHTASMASGLQTRLSTDDTNGQESANAIGSPGFSNIKTLFLQIPLWKRILDITGATISLAILSPVFVMVALYIKCVSAGPVFFKQVRIGYGGEVFRMWKFRTMHTDADQGLHQQLIGDLLKNNDQPMKKLTNDPRIIPLGNLLRRFCIDELPQFINVLKGEMSLVGPRPDPVYAIDDYSHWYSARFDATPGMTGLWQVSGKNRLSFQQMIRLDIAYARRWSLWLDIKILLRTVPAILSNAKYDA